MYTHTYIPFLTCLLFFWLFKDPRTSIPTFMSKYGLQANFAANRFSIGEKCVCTYVCCAYVCVGVYKMKMFEVHVCIHIYICIYIYIYI